MAGKRALAEELGEDGLAVFGDKGGEVGVRRGVGRETGRVDGAVGCGREGAASREIARVEGVAVGWMAGEAGVAGLAVGKGEEDGVTGRNVGDGGADG